MRGSLPPPCKTPKLGRTRKVLLLIHHPLSAYNAKDLEDFMTSFWETWALSKDPENLLVMLHTWQAGDCSKQEPYNGDFEAAMGAIKAKSLVMPSKTDLYFP